MTERTATVDDLFGRDRRDERTVLVDATDRAYDAHWLCTTAWKAGNFLRHSGVREGVTVGVVGDGPLSLIACFGTTLLGGTTRFEPPTDLADADEFQALVAPVSILESDGYDLPRGAKKLGYGDEPDAPDVQRFDAGLWSENPSFPPRSIDPDTAFLTDGDRTVSHRTAVEEAREFGEEHELETGDRVVVRESLADPRTVIAGVLAPLLADGVVVLSSREADVETGSDSEPDSSSDSNANSTTERGPYAVSSGPVPESVRLDPASVSLSR